MTSLQIYAVTTPILVFALAVGVVVLTSWQDQRDLQRQPQARKRTN